MSISLSSSSKSRLNFLLNGDVPICHVRVAGKKSAIEILCEGETYLVAKHSFFFHLVSAWCSSNPQSGISLKKDVTRLLEKSCTETTLSYQQITTIFNEIQGSWKALEEEEEEELKGNLPNAPSEEQDLIEPPINWNEKPKEKKEEAEEAAGSPKTGSGELQKVRRETAEVRSEPWKGAEAIKGIFLDQHEKREYWYACQSQRPVPDDMATLTMPSGEVHRIHNPPRDFQLGKKKKGGIRKNGLDAISGKFLYKDVKFDKLCQTFKLDTAEVPFLEEKVCAKHLAAYGWIFPIKAILEAMGDHAICSGKFLQNIEMVAHTTTSNEGDLLDFVAFKTISSEEEYSAICLVKTKGLWVHLNAEKEQPRILVDWKKPWFNQSGQLSSKVQAAHAFICGLLNGEMMMDLDGKEWRLGVTPGKFSLKNARNT